MRATANRGVQAEAVRIGAQRRRGFFVPAGHRSQAQHFLSGARPQRDAIGARGRLQRRQLAQGAAAVQVGTPFAVTQEGDAHPNFKKVLAEAKPEDIVTFMSVAGLPARAVLTPWLKNYLKREKALQSHAKADQRRCVTELNCLTVCGLRDGLSAIGQFCIDTRLAFALKGDVKKGLFFRGSESLPFGSAIRPVAELIDYFLTGRMPDLNPAPAPGCA
jgi:nitronate monooxygenase